MDSRNSNTYLILTTLIAIMPVIIPFFIKDIVESDGALLMLLMIYTWLAGLVLIVVGISAIVLARKGKRTIWVGIFWSADIIKEVFLSI